MKHVTVMTLFGIFCLTVAVTRADTGDSDARTEPSIITGLDALTPPDRVVGDAPKPVEAVKTKTPKSDDALAIKLYGIDTQRADEFSDGVKNSSMNSHSVLWATLILLVFSGCAGIVTLWKR